MHDLGLEFRIVIEILDMEFVLQTRRAGFRELKCVCAKTDAMGQWLYLDGIPPNLGFTRNRIGASIYSVRDIIDNRHNIDRNERFRVMILDPNKLALEPPSRKFRLEDVMNAQLLNLLRIAPRNAVVRSHVQAMFGEAIPDELATFEQIKEWLEFKFPVPRLDGTRQRAYGIAQTRNRSTQLRHPVHPNLHLPSEELFVPVHFSEIEYGRANYTVRRSLDYDVPIDASNVTRMVRDGLELDGIVREITEIALQNASGNDPGGGHEDYDYNNHECNDSDNQETTVYRDQLTELLVAHIRRHYGPQEAEEILGR